MLYKVARGAMGRRGFERRVCGNESAFAVTKNFGLIKKILAYKFSFWIGNVPRAVTAYGVIYNQRLR